MFGIIIPNENRGEYRYFIEYEEDISKNGHSYWKDEENNFDVQPFCVKLYRQRWNMVARSTYSYYYDKGR